MKRRERSGEKVENIFESVSAAFPSLIFTAAIILSQQRIYFHSISISCVFFPVFQRLYFRIMKMTNKKKTKEIKTENIKIKNTQRNNKN